jgi:protein Mpv17
MMSRATIKNLLLVITTSCITATAFSASFRPTSSSSSAFSTAGNSRLGQKQQHQHQQPQPGVSRRATQQHNNPFLLLSIRGGQADTNANEAGDELLDLDLDLDFDLDGVPAVVDAVPKEAPAESQRLTPVPGNDLFDESTGKSKQHSDSKESSSSCLAGVLTTSMMGLGQTYSTLLSTHPILTKSVTAGIIFGLSDWAAQTIENKGQVTSNNNKSANKEELKKGSVKQSQLAKTAATKAKKTEVVVSNKKTKSGLSQVRLVTSILVGLCYFGPAAHYWYEWIFQLLPSTTIQSTMAKAALGQVVFGPIFTIVFFATSLLQSGDLTLGNLLKKIKSDLVGVWAAGLGFWPIVDFISYRSIPIPYIPLFVNFCSFIWTIYLSMVSNKADKSAAASA